MLTIFPVSLKINAVTWDEINKSEVFLKQELSNSCTACAATMLIRRVAMMRGDSNWNTISESEVRAACGWESVGLGWDFSVRGIRLLHSYDIPSGYDAKASALRDMLSQYPEGIVVYDENSTNRYSAHAILITDFTNGQFWCCDPANNVPKGRIPISLSLVRLEDIDAVWRCVSPAVSLEQDVLAPSKPNLQIAMGSTVKPTTFSWAACTNATRYDVRIYQSGSDEVMIYQETTDTSTTVLLPQGSYYANVAATNTDANTYRFSDNVSFDVGLGVCEPTAITSYNGHIYALYENKTYYDQAIALCQQMGGHLATITSEEENTAIKSLLKNTGEYSEYWLGASDVVNEDMWVWCTAEPFNYDKWRAEEPNNANGGEHYVTIYRDGTWNDSRSIKEINFGFILEIEPLTPTVIKEYNNHVYYRFDNSMNWKEAKAYCELLGGHLVTISDQKENDFVANLVSNGSMNLYWLGLYDSNGKKDYKWVDGIDNTYRLWEKEQPNCDQGIQFYAAMVRGMGDWNDLANYTEGKTGFVCEIEKSVTSVSIKSKPNKLTYYLGEKLDLTGLSLLVKYQVGEDTVATSGFTTSFDMNSLGEKIVTVTYAGKTATFKINVISPKPIVSIQSKTDKTVNVSWTGISVADEYAILLNGTEIARTTNTQYSFANLKPVTAYEIQVVAYDSKEVIERSDVSSVVTANSITFSGDGTIEAPYIIANYEDLKCLSDMINDKLTNPHFKNAYYKQTADIDMNHQEFIPIGSCETSTSAVFAGNYNGNYHKIINLNVTENAEYAGLFGKVGDALNTNNNCQIKNLIISGSVKSESKYTGGIVGMLNYNASIYGCAFLGDVSSSETAGGIVGYIENGGIVDACYHNGNVTGKNAGGIIGKIFTGSQREYNVYVISSYHHNGKIHGTDHSGGIIGTTNDTKVLNLLNNYFEKDAAQGGVDDAINEGAKAVNNVVLISLAETLGVPYSNNPDSNLNEGAPVFKWQLPLYEFSGQGTAESPFLINNKEELLVLAEYLNDLTLTEIFNSYSYLQTNDIDLSNYDWTPISKNQATAFSGIYDGGCHRIINLSSDRNDMSGFFGYVSGGTIKNLVIENGMINSNYAEAGGIAAIVDKKSAIHNCGYIGTVTGHCSGGLVGTINNDGSLIGCYQNGQVKGEMYAGGLVGKTLNGNILMQNCYHGEGIVTGEQSGGLIGNVDTTAQIVNSFYLKTVCDCAVNNDKYTGAVSVNKTVLSALGTTLETPFTDNSYYGYPTFTWQIENNNEKLSGDANGDGTVDMNDVEMVRQFFAGGWDVELNNTNADVNCDNIIDLKDAVLIRRYITDNSNT